MPPASLPAVAATRPGPMTAREARPPRRRATARRTPRPPRRSSRRPASRTVSARVEATRRFSFGHKNVSAMCRPLPGTACPNVVVPALLNLPTQLLQAPDDLDLLLERKARQTPPARRLPFENFGDGNGLLHEPNLSLNSCHLPVRPWRERRSVSRATSTTPSSRNFDARS